MKVIQQPIKQIIETIGYQEIIKSKRYRPLRYTLSIQVDKGILIYNILLGSLVLREPGEDHNEFMIKTWYYVIEEFDDIRLVKELRKKLKRLEGRNIPLTTYTIFSTTDCNANCPYCFELGRTKMHMSLDIAKKSALFILGHAQGHKVNFRWFGGEPLYNQAPIDCICSILKEHKVDFISRMATNGFLFDNNSLNKAKQLWNLTQVQITLDGTRELYNKTKKYNNNVDGFERVLENIVLLTKNNIEVVIRLNVDNTTIDSQLKLLKDELFPRFAGNRYITIYTHLLNDTLITIDSSKREKMFCGKRELDKLIVDNGFSRHKFIPKTFKLYRCIADNKHSITILPSGKIGLCEHFTESYYISNLDNFEKIDKKAVKNLRRYKKDLKICLDCVFYPRCIRLVNCPDMRICCEELKNQNVDHLKTEALNEYKLWLEKTVQSRS